MVPLTKKRLTNSSVQRNLDSKLSATSRDTDLFPNVSSRTDQIYHDVDVGDAAPLKQHRYRLNPSKQQYLKEEIKYMLDLKRRLRN